MLSTLMFLTLAVAAIIGVAQFLWFLRRSRNRELASEALLGSHQSAVSWHPEGALSEIIGLGAVALLAMALLLYGYNRHGYESAKNVTPPAENSSPASVSDRMTQPPTPRASPAEKANAPTTVPNASGAPADATKDNPPRAPAR